MNPDIPAPNTDAELLTKQASPDWSKVIVLCLDIDQTLLNTETSDVDMDFNGSNAMNDPSAWINLIENLQKFCKEKGFLLIVQVISAKKRGGILEDGTLDPSVAAVASCLQNVLPVLDTNACPIVLPAKQFMFTQHQFQRDIERLYVLKKGKLNSPWETEELLFTRRTSDWLKPIHLCFHNTYNQHTSKSAVMHYISRFFNGAIPPANIFLVDDKVSFLQQATSNGFQTIPATSLLAFCGDSPTEKQMRTEICQQIVHFAEGLIKWHILKILGVKPSLTASRRVSPQALEVKAQPLPRLNLTEYLNSLEAHSQNAPVLEIKHDVTTALQTPSPNELSEAQKEPAPNRFYSDLPRLNLGTYSSTLSFHVQAQGLRPPSPSAAITEEPAEVASSTNCPSTH